jgi:hypothetical protein
MQTYRPHTAAFFHRITFPVSHDGRKDPDVSRKNNVLGYAKVEIHVNSHDQGGHAKERCHKKHYVYACYSGDITRVGNRTNSAKSC